MASLERPPPPLLSQTDKFERCASIWFCPPEDRTARELQELPKTQRERLWADMSGNSEISTYQVPPEDPAKIANCAGSIRAALEKGARNASASGKYSANSPLGQVFLKAPEYVMNSNFLLKFMRTTDFDADATLGLLSRHFQIKRQLFGDALLTRDIRLSDLSHGSLEALKSGSFQFLSKTDIGGRMVHFARPMKMTALNTLDLGRAYYYYHMVATENEGVQKRGVVRIAYLMDEYPPGGPDNEVMRLGVKIMEAVPLKCNALYIVANSSFWTPTVELMLMICSPFMRLRTRTIFGTLQECMYSMLCLGIPYGYLPITDEGEIRKENLMKQIEDIRVREASRIAC